ncbi:MAG: glycosyltransferase family 2 protein [Stellaceae bacterium]
MRSLRQVSDAEMPFVTVVMSPRERFSGTRRSIAALYENTPLLFAFVCVDGGSPGPTRRYLAAESRRRGFRLIRTEHYLTPNEARNLALREVETPYVVFIDNDVIVSPGWLEALTRCAEETGAEIVTPLICIGEPIATTIHFAGGLAAIAEESGRRVFREEHLLAGRRLPDVRSDLVRRQVELAEFHCVLVRSEVFQRLGALDENLKTVHEHIDLCLTVRQHGGQVMFEPEAVATYVLKRGLHIGDLGFYFYRWSVPATLETEQHFHRKWNIAFDDRTTRVFVEPHRRMAWSRLRTLAGLFIGRRLSMRLYDACADALARRAAERRERATA